MRCASAACHAASPRCASAVAKQRLSRSRPSEHMSQPVLLSVDARGVATLTLNRPDKHNAFDTETLQALAGHLRSLDADAAVRAIVLAGAGKTFCSGADLDSMRALGNA